MSIAFRSNKLLTTGLALASACGLGILPLYALAAASDDPAVVASINPPPDGLGCVDAAAATSVYFQFNHPSFAVKQVSLYLDGNGVPQQDVDERWPTVTLTSGMHPGRNTVDVTATSASGQSLSRRLVVLIGDAAGGDDVSPARVNCDPSQVASGQPPADEGSYGESYDGDSGEVVQDVQPVIEEQPVYEEPETVYDGPTYIYQEEPGYVNTWPIVPFFAFDVFYSHYHPGYYHRYGSHSGHWDGNHWDNNARHGWSSGGRGDWRQNINNSGGNSGGNNGLHHDNGGSGTHWQGHIHDNNKHASASAQIPDRGGSMQVSQPRINQIQARHGGGSMSARVNAGASSVNTAPVLHAPAPSPAGAGGSVQTPQHRRESSRGNSHNNWH